MNLTEWMRRFRRMFELIMAGQSQSTELAELWEPMKMTEKEYIKHFTETERQQITALGNQLYQDHLRKGG